MSSTARVHEEAGRQQRPESIANGRPCGERGQEGNNHHLNADQHRRNVNCYYETTFEAMKEHKDHPLRMKLLWDEISRAKKIKEAIEETPELDNISDYMCVQLALVCEDDMEDALQRAQGLQDFRREYGILESYKEGCHALAKMVQQVTPNFLLSFGFNYVDGNYIVVKDMAGLDSKSFLNPTWINDFFVGMFYVAHAANPDFHSIQKGLLAMIECKDMGWPKRHDIKLHQKLAHELLILYPTLHSAKHYNSGPVFNVMASAMKKLMPAETAKTFEVGLRFDNGLKSFFLVPDPDTARQRLLGHLQDALWLRFENEKHFSLPAVAVGSSVVPRDEDELDVVFEARSLL